LALGLKTSLIMMVVEKVKNAIREYGLIKKNERIVVGVSGGPDSVALLYALNNLKKELRLSLHIAHLDHLLRRGSGRDKEFVERLASRLKIPLTCAQINIRALAKKGSLEEIARNARLEFFFKVARRIKARKIALGHNLDDQAETVLMRILRGTGLYGLSGILPKRNIAGYEIIRPLIKVRRSEIQTFLEGKKIRPCLDASNRQEIYFRNKIRHRLLPLLERNYNKNIKALLSNLAEGAALDYDYLDRAAEQVYRRLGKKINLVRFLRLHPAMQRLLLRRVISRVKGNTRRITFRHIKEIEDMILNRPIGSVVNLPQGISVIKQKKNLLFHLAKSQ